MTTITIRPARPSDIDSLTLLLKALFAIEADFAFDETLQRHGLRLLLDNPRACVLVAMTQGRVVGMCTGQLTISTAEGGPALLVEDVVVHEDWQGRGLGRRLMKKIGRWATDNRAHRLQLLADRNNRAGLEFYKKLGWQTTDLICLRKREQSEGAA